jgi:hypothetical protein
MMHATRIPSPVELMTEAAHPVLPVILFCLLGLLFSLDASAGIPSSPDVWF